MQSARSQKSQSSTLRSSERSVPSVWRSRWGGRINLMMTLLSQLHWSAAPALSQMLTMQFDIRKNCRVRKRPWKFTSRLANIWGQGGGGAGIVLLCVVFLIILIMIVFIIIIIIVILLMVAVTRMQLHQCSCASELHQCSHTNAFTRMLLHKCSSKNASADVLLLKIGISLSQDTWLTLWFCFKSPCIQRAFSAISKTWWPRLPVLLKPRRLYMNAVARMQLHKCNYRNRVAWVQLHACSYMHTRVYIYIYIYLFIYLFI